MEEYIWRRQNMFAQFISTRFIMDLCGGTERTLQARVGMQWWDQAVIDLTGGRYRAAATAAYEDRG